MPLVPRIRPLKFFLILLLNVSAHCEYSHYLIKRHVMIAFVLFSAIGEFDWRQEEQIASNQAGLGLNT